jgi:hypothetical protein
VASESDEPDDLAVFAARVCHVSASGGQYADTPVLRPVVCGDSLAFMLEPHEFVSPMEHGCRWRDAVTSEPA